MVSEQVLKLAEAHEKAFVIMQNSDSPEDVRRDLSKIAEIMREIPGQEHLVEALLKSAYLSDNDAMQLRSKIMRSSQEQATHLRQIIGKSQAEPSLIDMDKGAFFKAVGICIAAQLLCELFVVTLGRASGLLWAMVLIGPILGVWLYRKLANTFPSGIGASIGLLGGLVTGIFVIILQTSILHTDGEFEIFGLNLLFLGFAGLGGAIIGNIAEKRIYLALAVVAIANSICVFALRT
jgi:hypothetical protein